MSERRSEPFVLALGELRTRLRRGDVPLDRRLAATEIASELGLSATPVQSVEFQAVDKKGGGPDFRIMSGATVLGAAWKKTSKANRDYISVKLDDPSLPRSVSAALFDGEEGYNLVWSRPRRRAAKT